MGDKGHCDHLGSVVLPQGPQIGKIGPFLDSLLSGFLRLLSGDLAEQSQRHETQQLSQIPEQFQARARLFPLTSPLLSIGSVGQAEAEA